MATRLYDGLKYTAGTGVVAGQQLTCSVADTDFIGTVYLEKMGKGGQFWIPITTIAAGGSYTHVNTSNDTEYLRFRQAGFVESQTITVAEAPDGGNLKLVYDSNEVSISSSEGASELQVALRAITGLGSVTVTGTYAAGFVITYVGVDDAAYCTDNTSDLTKSASPVAVTIVDNDINVTFAQVAAEMVKSVVVDNKGNTVLGFNDAGSVIIAAPATITGALTAAAIGATTFNGSGAAVITNTVSATGFINTSGVNDINSSETVTTAGTGDAAINLKKYKTEFVTAGSQGAESAVISATGAIIGMRKLITLKTRTHASDSVTLNHALFSQGSDTLNALTLDTAGEFILCEFRGTKFEIIAASSGVVGVA